MKLWLLPSLQEPFAPTVFSVSHLNAQKQGSVSEVRVCVALLRLCLPVNQPGTCTLPVSKAQKGLKFTVPPIVREERLHRFSVISVIALPCSAFHCLWITQQLGAH